MSHTLLSFLNAMVRWPALFAAMVCSCMTCSVGGNQQLCIDFKEFVSQLGIFWFFTAPGTRSKHVVFNFGAGQKEIGEIIQHRKCGFDLFIQNHQTKTQT